MSIQPVSSARILNEIRAQEIDVLNAYLAGAAHDGTWNARHRTSRIGQRERGWVDILATIVGIIGHRAWIYKEGRDRDFWIVETTVDVVKRRCNLPLDARTGLAFVRGYFDAEGGVPRSRESRFYIQLSQKDRTCLDRLRSTIMSLGIECGKLHIPSVRVDPDYWRFGIRARSLHRFAEFVSSWHPLKRKILDERLMTGPKERSATGISELSAELSPD